MSREHMAKTRTISEFWAYFSLRMRRNAYLQASGQKSELAIRFGDADFL